MLPILPSLRLHLRTPRPATETRDGPTQSVHEKSEKMTPSPKFWTPRIAPKIPRKYQKRPINTQKYQNARWGYFFGIFGVFSWGSRISARGYFFAIFGRNSKSGHLEALWQVGAFLSLHGHGGEYLLQNSTTAHRQCTIKGDCHTRSGSVTLLRIPPFP